ncbi:putative C2H2-type domain-containing protein [Seiridium unicorne]|uniref:C2H2-type domain-containing protein n=1 Tax=Seiridium unicorne TaxID=138068 RepID=A0ABR2V9X1_9PEZI
MSRSSPPDGTAVVRIEPYNEFNGSDTLDFCNQQPGYDYSFYDNGTGIFAETSTGPGHGYCDMRAHGFVPTDYYLQGDTVPDASIAIPQQFLPGYSAPLNNLYSPASPNAYQTSAASSRRHSLESSPPPLLSRQASSPATLAPATPQQSPGSTSFTPSPVSSPQSGPRPRNFPCRHCSMVKKDMKARDRHEMETHVRRLPNQKLRGWFRCACDKSFCHYRKSNYTRHIKNCKQNKWIHPTFVCQCSHEDVDKSAHETHYMVCREGRGRVGRPMRAANAVPAY